MKKLLSIILLSCVAFCATAQNPTGDRVIARDKIFLKDYWISGIQRDTGLYSFSDSAKVPTSKAVHDFINARVAELNGDSILAPSNIIKQYLNGFKEWVNFNTDSIPGGVTNLYHTTARARSSVSLTTSGTSGAATYNNATGIFNIPDYSASLPTGWSLNGNAGTDPNLNSIGTTDFVGLKFITGSTQSGYIDVANNSTSFGRQSLIFNNTGLNNAAFGVTALILNQSGSDNTAIGDAAGYTNSSGSRNVFVGANTSGSTSTTNNATAVGTGAFAGADGVALGYQASATSGQLALAPAVTTIKMAGLGGTTGSVLKKNSDGLWVAGTDANSGVQSVTGDLVDNTDSLNPIINNPSISIGGNGVAYGLSNGQISSNTDFLYDPATGFQMGFPGMSAVPIGLIVNPNTTYGIGDLNDNNNTAKLLISDQKTGLGVTLQTADYGDETFFLKANAYSNQANGKVLSLADNTTGATAWIEPPTGLPADGLGFLDNDGFGALTWKIGEPAITPPFTANKYWTGYKTWGSMNTDSLIEGSAKLFYTNARARSAISLTTTGTSGAATYNNSTGVLNIPNYAGGTGEVNTASSLGTGTGIYSTKVGVDLRFNTLSTTDFTLVSNVFGINYTNAPTASTSTRGLLSNTDWNTFNSKQGTLTLTTTGTSGAASLIGNTLNIPNYAGGSGVTSVATSITGSTALSIAGSPITSSGTFAFTWTGTSAQQILGDGSLATKITNNNQLANGASYITQAGARTAISVTTTGSSGAATYNNTTGVLNIPSYSVGGVTQSALNDSAAAIRSAIAAAFTLDTIRTWRGVRLDTISGLRWLGLDTAYSGTKHYTDSIADLKLNKSMSAYSVRVNNTSGTANATSTTFRDAPEQTYSGTITWTATTAPSGTTNHTYSWSQIGKTVTLIITLSYATGSSAATSVVFDLPSDLPTPYATGGLSAGSSILNRGNGALATSTTVVGNSVVPSLRINSGGTGYEIIMGSSSGTYRVAQATIIYRAN